MMNIDMFDEVHVIRSGDRLEVKSYKDPQLRNQLKIFRSVEKSIREKNKEEQELYFKQSIYRSRKTVENLVYANVNVWPEPNGKILPPTFLTLTFEDHITNLKIANQYYAKFTKRLNYLCGQSEKSAFLKYVIVPELTKQKRVHYHILFFNLPFVPKKELEKTWRHGFIKVKKTKDKEGAIKYLLKYITKEHERIWPKNSNRYSASKGLKKPLEYKDNDYIKLFLRAYDDVINNVIIKKGEYSNKFCGRVEYFVCDLSKDPQLKEHLLAHEDGMVV